MPVLGLTMEEGTVAEWLKAEGDAVAKDEPLLTVEMDKGTVEVPSPAAGILRRIVVQPGTTVPVRPLIAEIADRAEAMLPVVSVSAVRDAVDSRRRRFVSPRARMRARVVGIDLMTVVGSGPNGRIVEADVLAAGATDLVAEPGESRVLATPLARRLAQEHGVSID